MFEGTTSRSLVPLNAFLVQSFSYIRYVCVCVRALILKNDSLQRCKIISTVVAQVSQLQM